MLHAAIPGKYPDPRQPLMDWVRQEDNPYFARAFVNRVWAVYFHVGLIDPPDNQNLANPPSNPALLHSLTSAFIHGGYDMKWLHREIANSRTYQLSCRAIGIVNGHVGAKANNYAATLFGKPTRQINCDCERSNEPSLLQTVYLRNDEEVKSSSSTDNQFLCPIFRPTFSARLFGSGRKMKGKK